MVRYARKASSAGMGLLLTLFSAHQALGYSFTQIVPDIRQPASLSGGSACPVRAHRMTNSGSISAQWSMALGTSPVTVLTQDQSASGRLNEIEQVIRQSFAVWTGVSGTTLRPASLAPLTRVAGANSCGSDGLNTICFNQPDAAFTPGVIAFARVITADSIAEQIGGALSAEPAQILDADIYFASSDARTTFATPQALPANLSAYDLESILTHELGHFLGFSHSAVWSAMMFPFAPAPGTYSGSRPTVQQPDAPLADDDRTGLRVLYPDPADAAHMGAISGRVLPANPMSLPVFPPGVTGLFGSQVVAVDSSSGAVVAAVIGGWSCGGAGPVQFDGSYQFERLATGNGASYKIYAEPLNGAADPSSVSTATATLCRNAMTDAGWPALYSCMVPPVVTQFTARIRTSP